MDRAELLEWLTRYEIRHPEEIPTLDRIRNLLDRHDRAFDRDCFPGHVTASAWIVSRESGAILLTHHRKLGRWLQLGGHTDGESDVLAAAIREAEEESGLRGFQALPEGGPVEILDVDVHEIPAHGGEPAHEHHDIRFLLEVSEAQEIERQSRESKEIRWFDAAGIERRFGEESLMRMARKAAVWLAREPRGPG
ncbi:MAG TPA: NUDIX domain-containing protein [Deltaproteobacteria bacterium]|nr:NUDIX domain-containing protein [Deltaproteobacteria bacterium]